MDKICKGDLFKKLQEIKEWQQQQQEKLLHQQKEQQDVLNKQHKRTIELFGLAKKDVGFEKRQDISVREHPFDPVFEYDRDVDTSYISPKREGIKLKEMESSDTDKENFSGNVSIDDIPLKSARKDFQELLREKLEKDDPGITVAAAKKPSVDAKPKRQFLKRGEGLKRFRMDPSKKILPKPNKHVSTALTSSKKSSQKSAPASISSGSSNGNAKDKLGNSRNVEAMPLPQNRESSTWANVFSQKSKEAVQNKPQPSVLKFQEEEKKPRHEVVDLEVFELLEQMAGDSSFCSTSSTLLGFMESPVISTPLKAILEKKETIEKPSKSTKQLPFGTDTSEGSDSSKDEFESSSDDDDSKVQKVALDEVKRTLPPGAGRVRFSNHIEEREFYAGTDDSTITEGSTKVTGEQFRDTEAWSDGESDSSGCDEYPTVVGISETTTEKEKPPSVPLKPLHFESLPGHNLEMSSQPPEDEIKTKNFHSEQDPTNIVFKSELLRNRMLELEREIETFRKENERLNQKKKLQEQEEARWLKEKRETEKKLQEKEDFLKNTVLEERKKFNREKQVFERYCKELRNQPTKQEREEVLTLQQKLTTLQQELRQKESRNAAAQARITTRLKSLEKENLQLKEEVEKLKKEKQLEAKRQSRLGSSKTLSNTKLLHSINSQLSQLQNTNKELPVVIQDVIPTKPIPSSVIRQETKVGARPSTKSDRPGRVPPQRSRTTGAGKVALNRPGAGRGAAPLRRIHSVPNLIQEEEVDDSSSSAAENLNLQHERAKDIPQNDSESEDERLVLHGNSDNSSNLKNSRLSASSERKEACKSDESLNFRNFLPISSNRVPKSGPEDTDGRREMMNKSVFEAVCDSIYPRSTQPVRKSMTQNKSPVSPSASGSYPVEKVNSDGSREIRYENGNFKRVSSDGLTSKLFYYNGDVKESLADGTIKYYYSETRTWHTTFPDGLEVLEFPNGQVERHCNGTSEVSFPDGTVRLIHLNGKEEVILPDGTMATIEPNGDQVIQLPNGQKEYQTKEYKKRVYPDGTVKIVYSDGVQETRYASGRVRLRDADGNLVLDQNPNEVE